MPSLVIDVTVAGAVPPVPVAPPVAATPVPPAPACPPLPAGPPPLPPAQSTAVPAPSDPPAPASGASPVLLVDEHAATSTQPSNILQESWVIVLLLAGRR